MGDGADSDSDALESQGNVEGKAEAENAGEKKDGGAD